MKKATLQISFDSEKLTALKQYMAKKGTSIETELEDELQKQYLKLVPVPVREYIESRDSEELEKLKKPSRPAPIRKNPAGDEE